jgi:hypothetical protein
VKWGKRSVEVGKEKASVLENAGAAEQHKGVSRGRVKVRRSGSGEGGGKGGMS